MRTANSSATFFGQEKESVSDLFFSILFCNIKLSLVAIDLYQTKYLNQKTKMNEKIQENR